MVLKSQKVENRFGLGCKQCYSDTRFLVGLLRKIAYNHRHFLCTSTLQDAAHEAHPGLQERRNREGGLLSASHEAQWYPGPTRNEKTSRCH